ncbi:M23 family metallopeptidase [Methylobacterium sp. A54F]
MPRLSFSPALAAVLVPLAVAPAAGADFRLRLPLDCELGRTCFVQHYVDRDPGPGARDYACGSRTYDKHNGIDFRLPSLPAEGRPEGVVRAAAAGTVLRLRNDAEDVSVRDTGVERVSGLECGNGAVVAHPDGYETQYCHMARGSLTVRPGQAIAAGQAIGRMGLSGATEFPHLHFTVRRNGQVVDPFAPDLAEGSCDPKAPGGLWEPGVAAALAYRAGTVLNAGFAGGPVAMAQVEGETVPAPGADAPALVAFVRTIGLDAGDVRRLSLTGPDGRVLAENAEAPLPRAQAQGLAFVGRKRPPEGWPAGTYAAKLTVQRGGAVALEHAFAFTMPAR